jgi:hypothetical protein
MSNIYKILMIFFLSLLSFYSSAHSGRTDANGGHNCSQASKNKGLCTGYHYHNSGTENHSHSTEGEQEHEDEHEHEHELEHESDVD